MRRARTLFWVSTGLVAMALAGAARADWDPGDPHKMHHPQMPDLQEGFDVLNGPFFRPIGPLPTFEDYYGKFLADDFLCTETGAITGVHLWNSYRDDVRMEPGEDALVFNLAIYSDIPASQSPTGYSMPGDLLWQRYIQPKVERFYADATEEFYDPNFNEILGFDTQVWQLNFAIDPGRMSADERLEEVAAPRDAAAHPRTGCYALGRRPTKPTGEPRPAAQAPAPRNMPPVR